MRYKNYLIVSLLLLCVTTTLFAKTSVTSYNQNDKAKIYNVYGKYLAKETEEGMPNVTDIIITGDSKARLNLEMGSVEMENATIVALYHESEGNTSLYLISGRLNVLTNKLGNNQDEYMLDIYTPIAEFTAISHADMTIAADQEDFVKLYIGDVDVLNGLSGDKYHLHAPYLYNFTDEYKLVVSPSPKAEEEIKPTIIEEKPVVEEKTAVEEKTTVTEPKEKVEPLNAPAFDNVNVIPVENIVEPTKEEVVPTVTEVTEKIVEVEVKEEKLIAPEFDEVTLKVNEETKVVEETKPIIKEKVTEVKEEKPAAPKFVKVTLEETKEIETTKPVIKEKTTKIKENIKPSKAPVITKVYVVVPERKVKKPVITKTTIFVQNEKNKTNVVVETNNLNKPEIKKSIVKKQVTTAPIIKNVKITIIEDSKKKTKF